jgi:cyclophilin family peptidyl-prolyl cis-trans isomerase
MQAENCEKLLDGVTSKDLYLSAAYPRFKSCLESNMNRHFIGLVATVLAFGWSTSVMAADPVVAVIKTTKGDIKVELDAEKAPITVENFVKYVKDGHYEGVIFHRVIDGFMIQTGGFTPDMKEKKTRDSIKNESSNGLPNVKYTLAMARTPAPNSASAQFFINTADNDFLDRKNAQDRVGYAVFGKVIDGQKVVDEIGKAKTGRKAGMDDVPVEPILIEKVIIEEKAKK